MKDQFTQPVQYDLAEIGAYSESEFARFWESRGLHLRNAALVFQREHEAEQKAKRDAEATAKRVATRAAHKAERHPKQAPEQAQEAEA